MYIYSSILHDNQRIEATQAKCPSVDEYINCDYVQLGPQFTLRRKWNSDTCYDIDSHEHAVLSEINKSNSRENYNL